MEETFPLRLICIEETLATQGGICFSPCIDWSFHIISHTWTKDVRDWSLDICTMMHSHSTPHDLHRKMGPPMVIDTYADLFQQHTFADKRGHKDLVEFLRILAADGVKKVWFDALCINQGDAEEKNREITHLGAYYARSEGCYVWCHGIGGGFRLWAPAPSPEFYKLPRWFSRVWTLQEFVLPKKLTFVVGMDMEGFTGYFSFMAFCRSTGLTWKPREVMSDDAKAKFGPAYERSLHLINSKKHFPCPHCVEQDRCNLGGNSGHVYYVERSSYFDLMEKSSYKSVANHRLPATFWSYLRTALQRLPSMLEWQDCSVEKSRRLQLAALAVREISLRDCSEGHDEDRLLSILALLQIEGKVQLRTGKGLEEQTLDILTDLLNVAKSSASKERSTHHDILALLCLVQFGGNPTISMSWAPTFTHQRIMGDMNFQKVSAYMFQSFKSIAQIKEISSLGLELQCPFMRAKVLPFPHHLHKCGTCDICGEFTQMVINRSKHFVLEVEERHHYSVFMWEQHDDDDEDGDADVSEMRFTTACPPTSTITIKVETSVRKLLCMTLDVWLLLLAQDKLLGCSDSYGLFLVCVGQDMSNLQKVGVLFNGPGWDPERDEETFSDASSLSLSASSTGEEKDWECVENEELNTAECSDKKEFEAWKEGESYMQEFASEDDIEEEEERSEEDTVITGEQEAGCAGEDIMALPIQDQKLSCMHEQEEEEEMGDLPTWEQDLESMTKGHFIVGGYGPFVPLHLFTFQEALD